MPPASVLSQTGSSAGGPPGGGAARGSLRRKPKAQHQVVLGKEFSGVPFLSCPPQVLFEDFVVGVEEERTITLTNVSWSFNTFKVLDFAMEISDFFEVSYTRPGEVSAGMSCELTVRFTPKVNEDIHEEIRFFAKTGPFSVPLIATTKKVVVDVKPACVPGEGRVLDFEKVVVAETASRTVVVTNTGALATKYELLGSAGTHPRVRVHPEKTDCMYLPPHSSRTLRFTWAPTEVGPLACDALLHFHSREVEDVVVSLRGCGTEVPIYVHPSSRVIDFACCTIDTLYRAELVLCNRGKASVKVTPTTPQFLRPYLEYVPKFGFIQPGRSLGYQLKFRPSAALLQQLEAEQAQLSAVTKVDVLGQADPVHYTLRARLTTADLRFSTRAINYGSCTIGEGVSRTLTVENTGMLPLEMGFIDLPRGVTVSPNLGCACLQPGVPVAFAVSLTPTTPAVAFKLKVLTERDETYTVALRATASKPPLQLSHSVVRFPATALGDEAAASVLLTNLTAQPQRYQFAVGDCRVPAAAAAAAAAAATSAEGDEGAAAGDGGGEEPVQPAGGDAAAEEEDAAAEAEAAAAAAQAVEAGRAERRRRLCLSVTPATGLVQPRSTEPVVVTLRPTPEALADGGGGVWSYASVLSEAKSLGLHVADLASGADAEAAGSNPNGVDTHTSLWQCSVKVPCFVKGAASGEQRVVFLECRLCVVLPSVVAEASAGTVTPGNILGPFPPPLPPSQAAAAEAEAPAPSGGAGDGPSAPAEEAKEGDVAEAEADAAPPPLPPPPPSPRELLAARLQRIKESAAAFVGWQTENALTEVDFGAAPAYSSVTRTVLLRNVSWGRAAPLRAKLLDAFGPFAVLKPPTHLGPGNVCEVTLSFTPSAAAGYREELEVADLNGSRVLLALRGVGLAPALAISLDGAAPADGTVVHVPMGSALASSALQANGVANVAGEGCRREITLASSCAFDVPFRVRFDAAAAEPLDGGGGVPFAVTPAAGVVPAGGSVRLAASFSPDHPFEHYRAEAVCAYGGLDKDIRLKFSGAAWSRTLHAVCPKALPLSGCLDKSGATLLPHPRPLDEALAWLGAAKPSLPFQYDFTPVFNRDRKLEAEARHTILFGNIKPHEAKCAVAGEVTVEPKEIADAEALGYKFSNLTGGKLAVPSGAHELAVEVTFAPKDATGHLSTEVFHQLPVPGVPIDVETEVNFVLKGGWPAAEPQTLSVLLKGSIEIPA